MRKICLVIIFLLTLTNFAFAYEMFNPVHEALVMRVEWRRASEPEEREEILKRIIENSPDTEEAQAAYWDLAELYLSGFSEERKTDAENILNEFLERYPDSEWALNFRLKLLDLYDVKNPERSNLKKIILSDKTLPAVLKASLN